MKLVFVTIALLLVSQTYSSEKGAFHQNIFDKYVRDQQSLTATPQQCSSSFLRNFIPQSYPIEVHTVETKDGYILTLHRIQGKSTVEGEQVSLVGSFQLNLGCKLDNQNIPIYLVLNFN